MRLPVSISSPLERAAAVLRRTGDSHPRRRTQGRRRVGSVQPAVRMHPVTLAFADSGLERAFRAEYQRRSLVHLRVSLLLAVTLYAGFGLLDGSIVPDVRDTAWLIRFGMVCPYILIVLGLTFHRPSLRYMPLLQIGLGLTAGGGIVVMIVVAQPPGSYLYYAGLLLTCSYLYTFFKLRFVYAAPVSWAIVGIYEVAAVSAGTATAILVNNTFFLVSLNLIGMFACYAMEQSTRSDFVDKRTIRERTTRLDAALRHAEDLAQHDPLTGLYNRRYFFDWAEAEVARCRAARRTLSVAMLDLDHFKPVNDRYGHAVGDRVLQAAAAVVRDGLRGTDVVCRYGGEEFLVLLPGAAVEEAIVVGERLRRDIQDLRVDGVKTPLTVSVGIATLAADPADSLDDLVDRADRALYAAKLAGRNRVAADSNANQQLSA